MPRIGGRGGRRKGGARRASRPPCPRPAGASAGGPLQTISPSPSANHPAEAVGVPCERRRGGSPTASPAPPRPRWPGGSWRSCGRSSSASPPPPPPPATATSSTFPTRPFPVVPPSIGSRHRRRAAEASGRTRGQQKWLPSDRRRGQQTRFPSARRRCSGARPPFARPWMRARSGECD